MRRKHARSCRNGQLNKTERLRDREPGAVFVMLDADKLQEATDMIEINGSALTQWDVGRSVKITGIEVEYAHFANKGDSKAVVVGVVDIDAKIPDFLLQTGKELCVYAVKDGITVESKTFYVKKRERPENYVYEDDQRNYIYELITNAEKAIEAAYQAAESANPSADKANAAAENANKSAASANEAADIARLAAKSATEAAVKAANTAKSLMVVGKVEGASIQLDDAIEQYLVGLRIYGKTTQDGTPSPDAPVELVSIGDGGNVGVSVAGKNLIAPDAIALINEHRNFTCYKDDGVLLPGGTYTMSIGEVCNGLYVYAYSDGTSLFEGYNQNSFTFTLAKPTRVWLNFFKTDTFSSGSASTIQLELGNTATAFESYKGQAITISTPNGLPGIPVPSGGNYTDANGQQWVCDEKDFARGVYVQRIIKKVFDGSEYWRLAERDESIDKVGVFYVSMDGTIAGAPALCNRYQMAAKNASSPSAAGKFDTNYSQLRINAIDYVTTLEDWRQLLGEWYAQGTPLVGEFVLATPIETPLPEEELAAYAALYTYKDHTTVSNDAGAYMELEYVMDAKKYIDSLVSGGGSAGILNATVE